MLRFDTTKLFSKDLDLAEKRGKDLKKLEEVLCALVEEKPLKGNWKFHRELHLEPDWLLIYKKTREAIIAVRTGTHSDLFFKQRR